MVDRDLSYLQTLNAVFATLTVFGIYVFCISAWQRIPLAVLMTSVFISAISAVNYNRLGANVDCGSMFFVLSTALTLHLWMKNRSQWLLILSAISFGIAIGTKYLMCIFALPIALSILLATGRAAWKPIIIYFTCAAAWGLWWYIRNFIYTGNPVHPFATDIFGLYLWNQEDVISQYQALLEARIPRNFTGFILMPYYAIKDPVLSSQRADLVITMLYASTMLNLRHAKKFSLLLLFCWIYLIAWFLGAQDPRYLMPIMPLIFVYCGATINIIFEKPLQTIAGKIALTGLMIVAIFSMAIFLQQQIVRIYYTNIGDTPQEIDASMRQNPGYDLVSHANEIFNEQEIIYGFFLREPRWFYKSTFAGNAFGPHGVWRMINNSVKDNGDPGLSPAKIEKNLKETYSAVGFIIPVPPYVPYNQKEFDAYFDLKYQNELGAIYRFKDAH